MTTSSLPVAYVTISGNISVRPAASTRHALTTFGQGRPALMRPAPIKRVILADKERVFSSLAVHAAPIYRPQGRRPRQWAKAHGSRSRASHRGTTAAPGEAGRAPAP
jgi:hypothetical protein